MTTQTAPIELYLARARAAASSQECMEIYDKWAATYDAEVTDKAQAYVAPVITAQVALTFTKTPAASVMLDAGCGTGLVGTALASYGAKTIDGIDLSPAMLKLARKTNAYRDLAQADLNLKIDKPSDTYDVVTCVGTFTQGHVGPQPALREFVRVTKKHGTILATILKEIWLEGGFKAEVEKMRAENLVTVLADELVDYVKGHGDKAVLLILKKNDRS